MFGYYQMDLYIRLKERFTQKCIHYLLIPIADGKVF